MRKKNLVTAVLVASMLVGSLGVTSTPAEAKSKIKLSTTKVSLNGGASKTIKIKGTKKKVKWSVVSGKKNIKLKNKKKTSVKVVGVKRGTAKVQAKLGKKKYICRVTVRKSTPAKTITITTADTQTAEVVHNALNTGKAVNLKVKGSKSSASKLMKQLSSKVGEYNKFDVVPQYDGSSQASSDSGYRVYSLSSTETQTYKYGLLLVKDIVSTFKESMANGDAKKAEKVKNTEARIRKDYVVGTENYANTFTEATGIPYDSTVVVNGSPSYSADLNYKDGQTAKPKQQTLYYWTGCTLDNSWSLPQDYYYITFTINGKQYTSTSELGWTLDRTKEDLEENLIYDEEEERYITDPSVYDNPDNYFLHHTTEDGVESRVYYQDVTFHYEPLTVDTAPVDQAIEKKVRADVERDSGYGAKSYVVREKVPLETTEFYKLSQAEQQYYISLAFLNDTTWCGYDKKSFSGSGLTGIKAMLNHKWWGKCDGYAAMETTMYELFGISSKDYTTIVCYECNHAWTAVRVTNARGERAWVTNNYGMGSEVGFDKPYRHYHDGKTHSFGKKYENFIFAK